jgi:diguanylate cyclase (GGDEF)-like protein
MFFKEITSEPHPTSEPSGSGSTDGPPARRVVPSSASDEAVHSLLQADQSVGLVLDALGSVLTTLARYPLETPDKPARDVTREMTLWQKHATLGYPLDESSDATPLGLPDRDWNGLVRAVTEQRQSEHKYVDASITELREALWSCVETVHKAVKVDHVADTTSEAQMERAKHALERLPTGSIKQEVLGAVLSIESALQTRRDQQQEQYVMLATKLDRLGKQLEEARRKSTTDALTGLGNRKLFDMTALRAIQMFSLSRQPVALFMINLDKLELVNDMYGHQAGDQAIINLATSLSKVFLRQSDVLCRVGGDEFAAILHNTDWKMAQTLGRRLQEHLSALPAPHPAMEFSVGSSVGVAQLEFHEEVEEWVARANDALNQAKQNGPDRCVVAEGLVP